MKHPALAIVTSTQVGLFGLLIIVIFLILFALFIFGMWLTRRQNEGSLSPYSKTPLRRGSDLSYQAKVEVLRFMFNMHEYDNRIFELRKSAVCRDTGRIFPNAFTWYGTIDVDWSFLNKRYPGKYVSWGSLSPEQQEIIRCAHDNFIHGFQTDFSSRIPQPNKVEAKYAFSKPGPLYVDLETKVLLGWKCVPNTDLEVLVVQKPMQIITISVT